MRSFLLPLILCCAISVHAQWSSDPANPLVICEALGHQEDVTSLDDGDGGWFVFWRDQRADPGANGWYEIYGQHIDTDGSALWQSNGQLIASHPGQNIQEYAVARLENGDLMMIYPIKSGNSADSLLLQVIDNDGSLLWPDGSVVASLNKGQIGLSNVDIMSTENAAFISYYRTIVGGQYKTYVDRVELDGTSLYGLSGHNIPTSSQGPFGLLKDDENGAYVHWRNSNGSGTHLSLLRIDDQCLSIWPNIVDPIAGFEGLNYSYRVVDDGEGGVAFIYTSESRSKFTRVDSDGETACTPEIRRMADFESGQDQSRIIRVDDAFIVLWEDNRSPASNSDLFVQKINLNGDPQWAPEGMLAIHSQTYIPYGRMVPTDSSGVLVAQLSSAEGLVAQRIRHDGTPAWENLVQFVDASKEPFYDDYTMHQDGEGGAVAFWRSFDTDEIYANKINFDGTSGISTVGTLNQKSSFKIWPNPTNAVLNIDLKGFAGEITLEWVDAGGRIHLSQNVISDNGVVTVDVSELPHGIFMLKLIYDGQFSVQRIVVQ